MGYAGATRERGVYYTPVFAWLEILDLGVRGLETKGEISGDERSNPFEWCFFMFFPTQLTMCADVDISIKNGSTALQPRKVLFFRGSSRKGRC